MQTTSANEKIRRRYKRKYLLPDLVFRVFDRVLGVFVRAPVFNSKLEPRNVRAVLVANAGHLGDLVFTTAVVTALKRSFPNAQIGILAGSWAEPIFAGNPVIARLHVLNHWGSDRSSLPRWRKVMRYVRERVKVVKDLRRYRYDVAIDVRMWFPNFIPVLRSADIPVRVGFDRVGFGPFLSHVGMATLGGVHEVDAQVSLVGLLTEKILNEGGAVMTLPRGDGSGQIQVRTLLGESVNEYRILHMGSSSPTRAWPLERWRALAHLLVQSGHVLVFTGVGQQEQMNIETVTQGMNNCVNACDRLAWSGLVELVRGAELVYSTETSVGHVAAAVGTPVVAVYGGTAEPTRWKPYGPMCTIVTHQPPCFPCIRQTGCREMACLVELSTSAVHAAGEGLMGSRMERG